MAKLTRAGLAELRNHKRSELANVDGDQVHVVVGMGTSGIAAGAEKTLAAITAEVAEHGLSGVVVRRAGSLGLDHAEPTVEIRMTDMPDTIYGKVTPEIAGKIVRKHIMGRILVNDHVFDRPAADLVSGEAM